MFKQEGALGQEACHAAPQLKEVQGVKEHKLRSSLRGIWNPQEREGWETEEAVTLLEFQAQFLCPLQ